MRYLRFLNTDCNLSPSEYSDIKNLKSNTNICITMADKSSIVVIMNISDFIFEANCQLQNADCSRVLQSDPALDFQQDISNFLKFRCPSQGRTNDDFNISSPGNPQTPYFCLLPKIHKQRNPGRPVVPIINCPTEQISAFIDFHLKLIGET